MSSLNLTLPATSKVMSVLLMKKNLKIATIEFEFENCDMTVSLDSTYWL